MRDEIAYDGAAHAYGVAKDPRCLWGWGPPGKKDCYHMFGHMCSRPLGHRGRCRDYPDGAKPDGCETMQRPKNWDSKQRQECNT